jgi:hypothetical protein
MGLGFRKQDRDRVADGEITVTYRLWSRTKVKAGGTYQTGFGAVEVEDVRVMPAAMVPEEDVAPSGCESVQAIWELAGEHTKTVVTADTLLHRVEFRFLRDAPTAVAASRPRKAASSRSRRTPGRSRS